MIELSVKEPHIAKIPRYQRPPPRAIIGSMFRAHFVVVLVGVISWAGVAQAQYLLVLKNGRQIHVQSYRDDGSMIKFSGLGGEIAISKDQVQTIRRAEEGDRLGSPSLSVNQAPTTVAPEPPPRPTKAPEVKPPSVSAGDGQLAKKRAEEQKAYEDKVKESTEQLRGLRERYSMITRGTKGPEPSFFTTEEAFKGQQADLISRLRDAQYKAQGLPTGSASQSPPFSLDAPPPYTEREKELSDLRARITQVENDRQKLIEEMKAKNFETGSLFLD
jgi:hypothetical protein